MPPDYLEERLLFIEPIAAIDLGEQARAARFRRPLHFEQIARQILRIAVSLDRPDVQMLAAAQAECPEIMLMTTAADVESGFFPEFTACTRKFIFLRVNESLRYRPGCVVLPGPVRPTGMDEKYLHA